jgi:hypothetical protein
MGNMFAYGIRTFESTPIGLFIGTANPYHGLEVWRHSETLDLDAPINPLVPPPPAPVTTQINNPLKITAVDASAKVAGLIDALIRAMETRTDAAQIEQLLTATARAVALNSPDKVLLLTALQRLIASLGELGMSFTLAELNTIVGAVERAVLTMVHLPTVPSDLLPTGPIASTTTINQVLQQGTTLLQQSQALTTAP